MSKNRFQSGDVLIGRYLIKEFIAAGGMQEVYLCHDQSLNRDAVVKTPKEGVHDRRFRRGAEMGARVNHTNAAATFDYYEDDTITFLVEEFVPGRDLSLRLKDDFYYMDPSLAAHVIHHISRALFEAHRVGICHRDLKPSNIMTSPDPELSQIKLTDFGIAKLAEAEIGAEIEKFGQDNTTLTTSHTLLGAVPYMAPECWINWGSAGKPIDIWALGCIGYQLLTGALPFGSGAGAIGAVMKAMALGKVELNKPSWFGRHINTSRLEQELWDVIMDCLNINPELRPSAESLIKRCDALCYAIDNRRTGVIFHYGLGYGGKSKTGKILDDKNGTSWFFHQSEFFGENGPADGQHVSFSVYPGFPNDRSSPVLLVK